jgi:hypothetical protein
MAIREHTSLQRTQKRVSTKVLARASHTESEKVLEAKLRKAVESRGWMALKLLSQLHRGLPDRLILAEYGITFFAEIKTTGKKPTKLQLHCHAQLRELGFQVFVIDTTATLETAVALMDRAVIAERIKRDELGEL